jgi:uncharacterized protein (TIGR03067 family)
MQGTWALIRCTRSGESFAVKERVTWTITGNQLRYAGLGALVSAEWAVTLDARKKPKAIDLKGVGRLKGMVQVGSYSVDGDTLKISWGAERPTDLTGTRKGDLLQVFQRQKR